MNGFYYKIWDADTYEILKVWPETAYTRGGFQWGSCLVVRSSDPDFSGNFPNTALWGGQFERMATMFSYYRMLKYGYTVTLGATSMKLVPDMILTTVDE